MEDYKHLRLLSDNSMEQKIETIVLGGGCFWCTEAVFKMIKGVITVEPGYAGGKEDHVPTYNEVSGGGSGHAEVIRIEYDPSFITIENIFTVFFGSHDPTTLNRQGHDVGTQYRSIILYTTLEQKEKAEAFIAELNASNEMGDPIVTEVEPLGTFYGAESYHRDYYARNSDNQYCELVINPKLEKVQQQYAELLNKNDA